MPSLVVPAQIRAGRALLDWSQEQLATAAEVGLSTIRDLESQKRPAETAAAAAVRRALENERVIFIEGSAETGPGVCLADNRPNMVRRPTVVTQWDGVPFDIEWQGKPMTVFVSREVLEDLEQLTGTPSDEALLRAFEKNRGRILDAVTNAIIDPGNFDKQGRLYVRGKDVFDVAPAHLGGRGFSLEQLPAGIQWFRLRPLPKRLWRGERQEPADYRWRLGQVELESGRIVIENSVTGHNLPLYRSHIRNVVPDVPAADGVIDALIQLTMQLVFEDGIMRWEFL
ncbi:DUF1488 family protein [Phenylobacterium sp.]|jgi:transcriptional regulator with XRE-family HTH domain|uniref:DUF1488 family protein n=1 Tax=Phenylobacterium sp. TaxID=1871053 RepID=UPI002732E41D|nr:DUF1488 family protein [Phenylobacterium sp.]MDP3659137.1 DUF1488 family protein [Phenylobacterium sp.]